MRSWCLWQPPLCQVYRRICLHTHTQARVCSLAHTHAQACTLTYADLLSPLPFLRAQGGPRRLKRDSRKSFICLCCLIKSLFCQFCFTVDVPGPVYFSIASLRSEMGLLDTRKKVLWLTQRLDASSCSPQPAPQNKVWLHLFTVSVRARAAALLARLPPTRPLSLALF